MAKQPVTIEDVSELEVQDNLTDKSKSPVCGIIMPIADTEGYPLGHWRNVHDIICEASTSAGFKANLVSSDDDVAVIQKRIVQNIYDNPIVVCDISAKNANVMFELGMRLAFDKPTVIIKDERTPYSFDISSIEHLDYPSDLRYQSINVFKERLAGKIKETYLKSINDPSYTTFLKHFGTFKVAQLDQKEVSESEYLASEIKDLKSLVISLVSNTAKDNYIPKKFSGNNLVSETDSSVNVHKSGVASYVIEPNGFVFNKVIADKLIEAIITSGLDVEQYTNSTKKLTIHFKSALTKEEESIFKDRVVYSLL